ncbi:hypothetical protein ACWATR_01280 [Nostoc sp. UIC 10890]
MLSEKALNLSLPCASRREERAKISMSKQQNMSIRELRSNAIAKVS